MKEIITSGKGENSMEKDILNLLDTQNKIMLNILDLIADSNRWYTINEISTELLLLKELSNVIFTVYKS